MVPSPICPSVLFPQHTLLLSSRIEQECSAPTSIDIAVRPGGSEVYLKEVEESVVPSPNWPMWFLPQQPTLPLSRIAQACRSPVAIAASVRFWGRIEIGVGVVRLPPAVPTPSWPSSLPPQHIPVPSSKMTQVESVE